MITVYFFVCYPEFLRQDYRNLTSSVEYVISGGGGRHLYPVNPANLQFLQDKGHALRFFAESHGFVTVEFDTSEMLVEFFDVNSDDTADLVYSFSRPVNSKK